MRRLKLSPRRCRFSQAWACEIDRRTPITPLWARSPAGQLLQKRKANAWQSTMHLIKKPATRPEQRERPSEADADTPATNINEHSDPADPSMNNPSHPAERSTDTADTLQPGQPVPSAPLQAQPSASQKQLRVNGVDYPVAELSLEARQAAASLQAAETEINQLQVRLALARAARKSFADNLQRALPARKPPCG